jgi:hypothetical protein
VITRTKKVRGEIRKEGLNVWVIAKAGRGELV